MRMIRLVVSYTSLLFHVSENVGLPNHTYTNPPPPPPAKSFTYTHPPLKPLPTDLLNSPLLHAKAFHLFGPPEEILILVPELLRLRDEAGTTERPLFVWEPLPSSCVPGNYGKVGEACKLVDVFSPNHIELGALCGGTGGGGFDGEEIEGWMGRLVGEGVGVTGDGVVVVRAGKCC